MIAFIRFEYQENLKLGIIFYITKSFLEKNVEEGCDMFSDKISAVSPLYLGCNHHLFQK